MPASVDQTIVTEKLETLSDLLDISKPRALLNLVYALATDEGYDALDDDDVTDGGDDNELDVVSISHSPTQDDEITVTVIAATTGASHSTHELQRLGIGLEYLLKAQSREYSALDNRKLVDRIKDFRRYRNSAEPPRIGIQVYFASLGLTKSVSKAFNRELLRIRHTYSSLGPGFSLTVLGAENLSHQLRERESRPRRTNATIRIDYDRNAGRIIERKLAGASGFICSAPADEIGRLVSEHPGIFDDNLRRYLKSTNPINSEIYSTCTDPNRAKLFWFLNNGITVICDEFTFSTDADQPLLYMKNVRIVNGCQTSSVLAEARRNGKLDGDTWVLLRVFSASGATELAKRVVVTTNTQTRITGRDLCSNDPIHEKLQQVFMSRFGLHYERKPNEFISLGRSQRGTIVSNERIGQAYMAIVLRRPSDGARRKYKLWGDTKTQVFHEDVLPEAYLLAYRIWQGASAWRKSMAEFYSEDDAEEHILANGSFHIARLAAYFWRGDDIWDDLSQLQKQLSVFQPGSSIVMAAYRKSLRVLTRTITKTPDFAGDIDTAMKSPELDRRLNADLYRKKPKRLKEAPKGRSPGR